MYNRKEALVEASKKIWSYAELKFETPKSVLVYYEILNEEGFDIEKECGGLAYAFHATYGSGKPHVAILAEYDALAGMSQRADVGYESPLEGETSGHGCGHNLLGIGSLSAALEIKDAIDQGRCPGTVHLFGCPAEESGYGKAIMNNQKVFEGMDFALTWHPHHKTEVWSSRTLAVKQVYYNFEGIASHAALHPEQGRSALDACELMNVGVNYLREHVGTDVRMHYSYHHAGSRSANVVSPKASLHYFIRAQEQHDLESVYERVSQVAEGAALMSGTQVSIEEDAQCRDFVANKILSERLFHYATKVMKDVFSAEHEAYVAQVFKSTVRSKVEPLRFDYSEAISTDVGDVSWSVPTAQIFVCCEPDQTSMHSWQWVSNGTSDFARAGMFAASRILSQTAIEVMNSAALLTQVEDEFNSVKTLG